MKIINCKISVRIKNNVIIIYEKHILDGLQAIKTPFFPKFDRNII